ncbi:MAG: hypothetical protein ACYS8W_08385 [Planctomycetota bacterium]|jgi:hypothetical protein
MKRCLVIIVSVALLALVFGTGCGRKSGSTSYLPFLPGSNTGTGTGTSGTGNSGTGTSTTGSGTSTGTGTQTGTGSGTGWDTSAGFHDIGSDRVFDPKLEGAQCCFRYIYNPEGENITLSVNVKQGGDTVQAITGPEAVSGGSPVTYTWDGRDTSGKYADPGEYSVICTVTNSSCTVEYDCPLHIMRLGIIEIDIVTPSEHTNATELVFDRNGSHYLWDRPEWRRRAHLAGDFGDMDNASGCARILPECWLETRQPPLESGFVADDNFNVPAAVIIGRTCNLALTMGLASVSQKTLSVVDAGYPHQAAPVRLTIDGFEQSEELVPGATVTLNSMNLVSDNVGKYIINLTVGYQYFHDENWHNVPGCEPVEMTVYRILGSVRLVPGYLAPETGAPYRAWIKVLDQCDKWAHGIDGNDKAAVTHAITEGIYRDYNLVYDTIGNHKFFSGGTFNLYQFINNRTFTKSLNCEDCAAGLSTFLNMFGIDSQVIHVYNKPGEPALPREEWERGIFAINLIKPIGRDYWTKYPILQDKAGFSWHEIVGHPGSSGTVTHVSDACLAADADADPLSEPCEELIPAMITWEYYIDRVARFPTETTYYVKDRIQFK